MLTSVTLVNMVIVAFSGGSLFSVYVPSSSENCSEDRRVLEEASTDDHVGWGQSKSVVTLHLTTVFFLSLRFLGLARGMGIEMATFVLMLQEISWNVQTFLIVLLFILLVFAMLYHILLVGETDFDDDEWRSFDTALWRTWRYAIVGEVDDGAFPTTPSFYLFSAFGLVIVIVMLNILIAIVSDSYKDAMMRSAPLFWRARVDLIAE